MTAWKLDNKCISPLMQTLRQKLQNIINGPEHAENKAPTYQTLKNNSVKSPKVKIPTKRRIRELKTIRTREEIKRKRRIEAKRKKNRRERNATNNRKITIKVKTGDMIL